MAKRSLEKAIAGEVNVEESRLEFWRFSDDVGVLAEADAAPAADTKSHSQLR